MTSCEALKVAAEALGDIPTANLAEEIQRERERERGSGGPKDLEPNSGQRTPIRGASNERKMGNSLPGEASEIASSPLSKFTAITMCKIELQCSADYVRSTGVVALMLLRIGGS